jgi:DNA polymerase-3 subunit epsilon
MSASTKELFQMVTTLEMSGAYKVLERFSPKAIYQEAVEGADIRRLMVVVTETTGVSVQNDVMIEFGYVVADFDSKTGEVLRVVTKYQGNEDPARPVSAIVTRLTGITDAQLTGKRFDDDRVASDLSRVDMVISHNSGFERRFLEKRFPDFIGKWFGCSQRELDWMMYGSTSAKIEFLAFKLRAVYFEAQRSLGNAEVLLDILAHKVEGTPTPLAQILESSRQSTYRLFAANAPAAAMQALVRAGYQEIQGDEGLPAGTLFRETRNIAGAMEWLGKYVYAPGTVLPVDVVTGRERYSDRVKKRAEYAVTAPAPAGAAGTTGGASQGQAAAARQSDTAERKRRNEAAFNSLPI